MNSIREERINFLRRINARKTLLPKVIEMLKSYNISESNFSFLNYEITDNWYEIFKNNNSLAQKNLINKLNFKYLESCFEDLLFQLFPIVSKVKTEGLILYLEQSVSIGALNIKGKIIFDNIRELIKIDRDCLRFGTEDGINGILIDYYEELDGKYYFESTIWGESWINA